MSKHQDELMAGARSNLVVVRGVEPVIPPLDRCRARAAVAVTIGGPVMPLRKIRTRDTGSRQQ